MTEMMVILQGMEKKLQDMAKKMEEADGKLDAAAERDTVMLAKLEAIEGQLKQMAENQLKAILSQAKRFAEEMQRSNDNTSMLINAQALVDTVRIDKKDFDEIVANAFPKNTEMSQAFKDEFQRLYQHITDGVNHLTEGNNTNDNNNQSQTQAILRGIDIVKKMITETDGNVSKLEQVVRTIPGRTLH